MPSDCACQPNEMLIARAVFLSERGHTHAHTQSQTPLITLATAPRLSCLAPSETILRLHRNNLITDFTPAWCTTDQWRFYVGARGHRPLQILPRLPNDKLLNTGQLDTVVLLLVDVIGSIVFSLSRCCLPNDEGPGPPNIFS